MKTQNAFKSESPLNLRKQAGRIAIASAVALVLGAGALSAVSTHVLASDTKVAVAGSLVKNVTAKREGSSSVIRIELAQPLQSAPQAFATANPARVILDLPGSAGGDRKNYSFADLGGDVDEVNVVPTDSVNRVVVSLRNKVPFDVQSEGSAIVIRTSPVTDAVASGAGKPGKTFADGDDSRAHTLSAVDFRRGPSGEGRVLVDLSDNSTGIDIKQQGQTLIVDFKKSSIADQLLRRMNVTDFGTPVQSVNFSKNGDGVRMTVTPNGLWEYNAYQTDTRFVLEVKPVAYDPNKLVQGSQAGYKGDKLSLNFQNVDVRSLLNVIADFSKLNIVASDSVNGNMTIRLQDVPWEQALDIVLQTRGLDMRKNGEVIWVAPSEEIAAREKSKLESKAQVSDLEPVRTESFVLSYAKAAEVEKLLTNDRQRILSKRGSAVVDGRTNQLFVQDIGSRLDEVRNIIKKLDIPVRQVQIEARIVEASNKFSKSLGARLGFVQSRPSSLFGGPNGVMLGSTISGTGYLTGQVEDQPDFLTQGTNVNLPAPNLSSGAQAGSFAFTLMNSAGTKFLNLELSAIEADGSGKIISSPSVVTADQEKALIEQGTELPYQQASASGATNIAFKKANLKLEVTPQITPDGNVIMAVDINKDAPAQLLSNGNFTIDTKHIQTKVLVENGGTVVIGGIFMQQEGKSVNKVPLLGDLPVIGNVFRNTVTQDDKTELLVFLTPRVIGGGLNVPAK